MNRILSLVPRKLRLPMALAGGVLLGTGGVAACNTTGTTKPKVNKGDEIEITFADLAAIFSKFSSKLTACDITKIDGNKLFGSSGKEISNNLAAALATHLIDVVYSPKRAKADEYVAKDHLVSVELQKLVPNQKQAVIKELSKHSAVRGVVDNLANSLSDSQRDTLARACGERTGGVYEFGTRLGNKLVLSGLTRQQILDTIAKVAKEVTAKSGKGGPDIIVCAIDAKPISFKPFIITRGNGVVKQTLFIFDEKLNVPKGAKIRLDFGHGVTVHKVENTAYGLKVSVRIASNASLRKHNLTIYINGQKVRVRKGALLIKEAKAAPQRNWGTRNKGKGKKSGGSKKSRPAMKKKAYKPPVKL